MIIITKETTQKMIDVMFGLWLSNAFGSRRPIELMQQQVIDAIADKYNLSEQERDYTEMMIMRAIGESEYNAFTDGLQLGELLTGGFFAK